MRKETFVEEIVWPAPIHLELQCLGIGTSQKQFAPLFASLSQVKECIFLKYAFKHLYKMYILRSYT